MSKRSWLPHAVWLNIFLFGVIGLVPHTFAQNDTFSYDDFSLTLPEGWVKQDTPKDSKKNGSGPLNLKTFLGLLF